MSVFGNLRGKTRGTISPLIKSLIFIATTLAATALLAASIMNTTTGDRVAYRARFTDVAGLYPAHSVRIAGVQVGQVKKIEITNRRLALVTFTVDRNRRLPNSVTASVKYLNLVGGRYIDLDPGAPGAAPGAYLSVGSTIPEQQTQGPLNLTQLFKGFQPLMQALSPGDVNKLSESIIKVLQGEGGTLESLMRTVGSLTSTLADKDQVIGDLINNLNEVTVTINNRDRQVVDLIRTLRALVSGLSSDRQPIGEAIAALDDLTNSTANLLKVNQEPLARSITQLRRLTGNLEADKPLLERFLQRTPTKLEVLGRAASYGSWVNFYRCEVRLTGVRYNDGSPAPTGIPLTDDRCKG
ncbi:MCE family protein [Actinomadura sp. 6N118]|uniref:MCE family protein n=1 Tax=Actinomadura sp. 6N118 TaxID=3375151 RepID=UPI00378EDD6C